MSVLYRKIVEVPSKKPARTRRQKCKEADFLSVFLTLPNMKPRASGGFGLKDVMPLGGSSSAADASSFYKPVAGIELVGTALSRSAAVCEAPAAARRHLRAANHSQFSSSIHVCNWSCGHSRTPNPHSSNPSAQDWRSVPDGPPAPTLGNRSPNSSSHL